MKEIDTNIHRQLDKWNKEFWVWVLIKSKKNDSNEAIINGFRSFCEIETNNDYTQGLKRLLEYYEIDSKYEMFARKFVEIEEKIAILEASLSKPKKKETEKKGVF